MSTTMRSATPEPSSGLPEGEAAPQAAAAEPSIEQYQAFLNTFVQGVTGNEIPIPSVTKLLDWGVQFDPQSMPALAAKWGWSPGLAAVGGKLFPTTPEQEVMESGLRHLFAGAHDALAYGDSLRFADAIKEYEAAGQALRDISAQWLQLTQRIMRQAQTRFAQELRTAHSAEAAFKDGFQLSSAWQAILRTASHEELQSQEGVELSATVMRCRSRLRAAHNRIVEFVSVALNVPTRAEVDEAYRLIHELRREVRSLNKRSEEASR